MTGDIQGGDPQPGAEAVDLGDVHLTTSNGETQIHQQSSPQDVLTGPTDKLPPSAAAPADDLYTDDPAISDPLYIGFVGEHGTSGQSLRQKARFSTVCLSAAAVVATVTLMKDIYILEIGADAGLLSALW